MDCILHYIFYALNKTEITNQYLIQNFIMILLFHYLEYFQRPEHNRRFLFVITGLGKHSLSGVAKIRPAVIAHLTSSGYRYDLRYHDFRKL